MNPLSALFGGAVAARNALYERGMLSSARLKGPVVSVGNLSVGGAGKTPLVIALGQELERRLIPYDILSRGYGRKIRGCVEVPRGASADLYGDEPVLLQQELGAPIFLAETRAAAGRMAESKLGARLHLLDDGFQHRQLARDFDIVVLSPADLEDTLLPVGRLREPLAALRRADAVVVPADFIGDVPGYEGPLWRVRRRLKFVGANGEEQLPRRPLAFCGLARPKQFFDLLGDYEIDVAHVLAFRDHHRYTERDIRDLLETATAHGAEGFVTTAKDAVKLQAFASIPGFWERLTIARLVTEVEDRGAAMEQMLAALRSRCPGWFV